ncbi:MAG: zinc-finger domain-containing protein [Proteobacteria bacterium]|nr:zinc-finger domain-containing protein [Pseudomonadota bacterium]
MLKQENVTVDKREVSCDGGTGALGHPLVYLEIGEKGRIECPYCSKVFVYESEGTKESTKTGFQSSR